jgi:hypothetical protein
MLQSNKVAPAFPGLWDTVASNWWYRATGIYEIHVTFDEDRDAHAGVERAAVAMALV